MEQEYVLKSVREKNGKFVSSHVRVSPPIYTMSPTHNIPPRYMPHWEGFVLEYEIGKRVYPVGNSAVFVYTVEYAQKEWTMFTPIYKQYHLMCRYKPYPHKVTHFLNPYHPWLTEDRIHRYWNDVASGRFDPDEYPPSTLFLINDGTVLCEWVEPVHTYRVF